MGGKETRERAVDLFVSVVQKSFFSFGKTFYFLQLIFSLFFGASCTSSLSSLCLLVCPPRLSSVSMFCRPLLPSVYLSTSLTPSPRVFRWPLPSAFLLLLCSTCALPGCISSSPASPKRYWKRTRESDNEMLLVENGSTDLLLCLWVFQSMSGLKLTWHFPMLHSVEADGSCSKAVVIISLLFLVEDRVQKQQRKHRQRGQHATSTGQSLHACWTQAGFYTLLAPYVDKDTIREGEIWHIMLGTRHSAWIGMQTGVGKEDGKYFCARARFNTAYTPTTWPQGAHVEFKPRGTAHSFTATAVTASSQDTFSELIVWNWDNWIVVVWGFKCFSASVIITETLWRSKIVCVCACRVEVSTSTSPLENQVGYLLITCDNRDVILYRWHHLFTNLTHNLTLLFHFRARGSSKETTAAWSALSPCKSRTRGELQRGSQGTRHLHTPTKIRSVDYSCMFKALIACMLPYIWLFWA